MIKRKYMQFFAAPDDAGGSDAQPVVIDKPAAAGTPDKIKSESATSKASDFSEDDKPDFSALGKVTGKEPAKTSTSTKRSEEVPAKPATEKQPEQKPAAKQAEEKKPAAVEAKKPEAEKKPAEEKKTEPAKPEKKELSDEEIEKLAPHPNTTSEGVRRFSEMKDALKGERAMRKQVASEIETLRKELEQTKKLTEKSITPELDAELKQLRALRQSVLKDADPEFQKEFQASIKTADDGLFAILRQNGLSEEAEKSMRDKLDSYDEDWWAKNILPRVTNPIQRRKVEDAILAREKVIADRQTKLQSLGQNHEEFLKQNEEQEKATREAWGKAAQAKAIELEKDKEWAARKDIPVGATEEQKQVIEAHNAKIVEREKALEERMVAAYQRDPAKTTETVYRSIEADVLEEQVKSLTTERDDLKARVDELEGVMGKARKISDIGRHDSAPSRKPDAPKGKNYVELGNTDRELPPDFSTLGRKTA